MLCKIYQIQLWKANLKKIGSSFGLHNHLFSAWFISWMNQGNLFQGKQMKHSSLFKIKHSVWCVKWVVQKKNIAFEDILILVISVEINWFCAWQYFFDEFLYYYLDIIIFDVIIILINKRFHQLKKIIRNSNKITV